MMKGLFRVVRLKDKPYPSMALPGDFPDPQPHPLLNFYYKVWWRGFHTGVGQAHDDR